ncbi:MAG: histidine phosphatase family protein [Stomatobaculum sp.]|nr:histidine phosphatase family protein [Stomatobaculum sp.]
MKILIIRHADPDYEIDGLTEAGKKEARLLAEWFAKQAREKDFRIDAAYQSPLGRARKTASYVLDALGITSETLPWLREFNAKVPRPDADHPTIAWDWLPQDLDPEDDFFCEKTWMNPKPMAESDVREKYDAVCEGIDALLLKHGYKKEGHLYRALQPNHDCIALFCHFGVAAVILSHMLNSSPIPLWHGFCMLPSSITTIYTEERREGIAAFRVTEFGALPHLQLAGEEPSFSARFCECYTDDTRHD